MKSGFIVRGQFSLAFAKRLVIKISADEFRSVEPDSL
jgi:hypothetical protein